MPFTARGNAASSSCYSPQRSATRRIRACAAAALAPAAAEEWRLAGLAPAFLELASGIEAACASSSSGLRCLPADPRFATMEAGAVDSRLRIENRFYSSAVFRRAHLELASGAGGLSVLHCVLYPWAARDLPLFSVDMVAVGSRVTLAIADLCPSRDDLSLPAGYERVPELSRLLDGLQLRETPEWGLPIFSRHCVCTSPGTSEEAVRSFIAYTLALLDEHLRAADEELRAPARSPALAAATAAAQQRFCELQLRNEKTRRVLASAMGEAAADEYMRQVLFDCTAATPHAPPQGDASS